jgi:predicted dehydrogenase
VSAPLRFGVIGAGRMGTNHVRVLSDLPGATLAAVCDAQKDIAEKTARRFLAEKWFTDVPAMLGEARLDAAVVATPTAEHLAAASACLARGVPVLLEKPLAASEAECDRLIDAARAAGVPLMVGHIERFNPAIMELRKFLQEKFLGTVYYVETVRSGPFPKRLYGSRDGVVIDLAVHDLDLVAYLFGDLTQLYANHIVTPEHRQDIHARVMFRTAGGVAGASQFSWISPRRDRSMTVYGDKGIVVANLIDQEIWFYENGDVGVDYSDNYYQNALMGRVSAGKVGKFPIRLRDGCLQIDDSPGSEQVDDIRVKDA